jgi:hypothetical protein
LLSDEEIESKVHDAIIEETITNKYGKRTRVRITINEIGEGFITKKHLPKNVQLPDGTPLSVEIKKQQHTERWLVSKIISINGENYNLEDSSNVSSIGIQEDFPDLDQRYVLHAIKGKRRGRIPLSYGLQLQKTDFLINWQENSYVKLSEYSGVHDIIPGHPESKFVGKIVAFNFFKGWQGFIYCKSINSLVYVRHNISRLSGSLTIGSKVEFFIGTGLDTRGELQFVARDWESNANRGNAPEPALTLDFEEFKQSRPFVESLLSDSEQFLLITSYRVTEKQVYNANEIVEYINKKYPEYPYHVLEWPKFRFDNQNRYSTTKSGAGRFTHPLIANHVSAAVVLFPQDKGCEEE